MEPLKEMFNKAFYQHFALQVANVYKEFDTKRFLSDVTANMEALSLNQRMRNTSVVLKKHLPQDYKKAIAILTKVIPNTRRGYTNLVFPDFVGMYGHEHFDVSMNALKYFTQFGSSEFAIREFLKRDFSKTISLMHEWAKDKNHHVRRLASEGSRPRLPWSFKLDAVIADPKTTAAILEALKNDEELYVRKSVANHLNDISKEHPGYMIGLVSGWDKANANTAWIVKHASRTLIKKGHSDSLSVFNFEKNVKATIENFKIKKNTIKLGEALEFSFDLVSGKTTDQKLVIDYVIWYQKKSADLSPKVFKLKELVLQPKQSIAINKKQVFKDFTTRKHSAGEHRVEIQVNGKILHGQAFKLVI